MTFIDAIKNCFVKYVHFSGRSTRSEYWYFFLFVMLLSICMDIVDATIAGETYWSYTGFYGPAQSIFQILIFLPGIAVGVRRLHDINKSGWWLCLSLTVIGIIPLIIWVCKASDNGSNNYGESPLENSKHTVYKDIPTWVKYVLIPIGSLICVLLVVLAVIYEAGIILESKVYNGSELSDSHKIELINSGIIDENDEIKYFYTWGFFSITDGGSLLTNDKLVDYHKNEDGLLKIYKMMLENVEKVELIKEGSEWSDSRYNVIGNENASYEKFEIFLSVSSGGDIEFINAIKERIK
jgi:uncharacterized membrane protein YhaH (DUF805 family)